MLRYAGAWSDNEKKGQSAKRQWKNKPEHGALEILKRAPAFHTLTLIYHALIDTSLTLHNQLKG